MSDGRFSRSGQMARVDMSESEVVSGANDGIRGGDWTSDRLSFFSIIAGAMLFRSEVWCGELENDDMGFMVVA